MIRMNSFGRDGWINSFGIRDGPFVGMIRMVVTVL